MNQAIASGLSYLLQVGYPSRWNLLFTTSSGSSETGSIVTVGMTLIFFIFLASRTSPVVSVRSSVHRTLIKSSTSLLSTKISEMSHPKGMYIGGFFHCRAPVVLDLERI